MMLHPVFPLKAFLRVYTASSGCATWRLDSGIAALKLTESACFDLCLLLLPRLLMSRRYRPFPETQSDSPTGTRPRMTNRLKPKNKQQERLRFPSEMLPQWGLSRMAISPTSTTGLINTTEITSGSTEKMCPFHRAPTYSSSGKLCSRSRINCRSLPYNDRSHSIVFLSLTCRVAGTEQKS